MRFLAVSLALVALAFADLEMSNANVTPFDSVDSDGNGEIDFNEFEKWNKQKLHVSDEKTIRARFSKFDTSKNSKIDVSEFVYIAYEMSKQPIDATQEIFKRMDLNGDRLVDRAEVELARKNFDAGIIDGVLSIADSNRDGQLSFDEFSSQLGYNKPKSQDEINRETAAQLLAFIDSNGDERLTAVEIHTFASKYNQISKEEVEALVGVLDQNNDKVLSITELEKIPGKVSNLVNIQAPPTV